MRSALDRAQHRGVQVTVQADPVMGHQGGGRVEQYRIADRSPLTVEQSTRDVRVEFRVPTAQFLQRAQRHPQRLRVDDRFGHLTPDDPEDPGPSGQGDLVETVFTADHQGR